MLNESHSPTEDLDGFRQEVAAFLEAAVPQDQRFRFNDLLYSDKEATRAFQKALNEKGWGAPRWPVEYGGCGWSTDQIDVFSDECTKIGAPCLSPFGLVMVGPVIYTFGSDALKDHHLPKIRSGEVFWCQGYSEPGAGSDLARLKTRAIRDGDDYVVNGQKIWTTQAHWADWIFCLVRTDTEAKPQRGISFLLIDMKTPGIEVRPIRTIDGMHHLNEVFFTDVRVPVTNLVGAENEGWTYAKFLLANERQGIAGVASSRVALKRLRVFAASTETFIVPPIEDPAILGALDDLDARLHGLAALEARALTAPSQSADAMRLAAPLKLLGSELTQDLEELAVRIAGPAALPTPAEDDPSDYDAFGGEAMTRFLMGRSHSIYGGTSEVQKNIIAGMMLRDA
ncbi:MAG: acyl-CoA dehydrogenase family protein [Pseudomonadota bacterium]